MIVAQEYVSLYLNIRCKGKKQRLFAPKVAQSISILKIQNVNKCSRFGLFEFGVISRCSKFILIDADTIYVSVIGKIKHFFEVFSVNSVMSIIFCNHTQTGGTAVHRLILRIKWKFIYHFVFRLLFCVQSKE